MIKDYGIILRDIRKEIEPLPEFKLDFAYDESGRFIAGQQARELQDRANALNESIISALHGQFISMKHEFKQRDERKQKLLESQQTILESVDKDLSKCYKAVVYYKEQLKKLDPDGETKRDEELVKLVK